MDESRQLFTVLVLGAAGAHSINMAVLDSLIHHTGVKRRKTILFYPSDRRTGCGRGGQGSGQMKMAAEVAPFFSDMAELYRRADLVICRSGATTVAELTVAGKAVVFIPFPFATDDHQVPQRQRWQRRARQP
ncbi:MAG: glycosyltransferase [Desulfobacterales bacterium]